MIGDIKKGKYVYYRCGGHSCTNHCYTRQEVFEEKFALHLKSLAFDQEVLAWICQALKQSNADKHQFHQEAVDRLQAEYKRLENRINAMYVDKLDRKITDQFFDTMSREWRHEQSRLLDTIKEHQTASQIYINEGIMLLELAQNAHSLFVKQSAQEKRRLLDYLISNSVWDGAELTTAFKQPFDIIAKATMIEFTASASEGLKIPIFENWLPGPDSNQRPTG